MSHKLNMLRTCSYGAEGMTVTYFHEGETRTLWQRIKEFLNQL